MEGGREGWMEGRKEGGGSCSSSIIQRFPLSALSPPAACDRPAIPTGGGRRARQSSLREAGSPPTAASPASGSSLPAQVSRGLRAALPKI